MWGTLTFAVALSLMYALVVSGEGVMGRLNWCKTLCMCTDAMHVEVKCFGRGDIYQLLDVKKIQVIRLERANWQLENQLLWCNDTCLCHQHDNQKIFKCVEEDVLKQFISDKIGDEYFYDEEEGDAEELPQDVAAEEEIRETEQRRRQEERRKNRAKNRKQRKRIKSKQELSTTTTTVAATSTTASPTTTEIMEIWSTLPAEVVVTTTQEPVEVDHHPGSFWQAPPSTPSVHASDLMTPSPNLGTVDDSDDLSFPTPEPTIYAATQDPPEEEYPKEEEEEEMDDYVIEDYAVESGLLPKQEAVAASPAVTAMQPPTRRQPFPPTTSSHTARGEVETLTPKVSAVKEVPVQRKTVASEVSQDLDELENAVMDIKSDVVLNQRILLVTVVVAGIAMLGVIVLAIHNCLASKRQAATEERRGAKEPPKEDNHVTKVNLEEAW
ncbi:proteoglycan 4-like [Macrobrachium rosenbergii]|uniref:proteoglycan 4-like n=1 Tax=Macrobrachium rosenbergii TaxID=79674 RepID=UPI0034D600B1